MKIHNMPFTLFMFLPGAFIALFFICSGNSQKADLRQLFQNYPRNQELAANLGTSYEVVYPVQTKFRGLSTRKTTSNNAVEHVSNTSFLIEAHHFKIYLDLELNIDLLPPTLTQYLISTSSRQLINEEIENCFYHATVRNHSGSFGAFRTCSGISGVLYLEDNVFSIHPLDGDHTLRHPHLLFHHHQTDEDQRKCDVGHGDEKSQCLQQRLRKITDYGLDVPPGKKYIELALILDQAFFEMHNSPPKDVISNAIQMINCADLHYQSLNTSISLVHIELWTEDLIHVEPSVEQNLQNIQEYLAKQYDRRSMDAIHMLSGATFNDSVIGAAETDSICTGKAVGITKVGNIHQTHVTSHVITHMLGHNLGMYHDDDYCTCPYKSGCHMFNHVESVQPFHFSSCSIEDYFCTLRKGYGVCLFNMPMLRESICGNGILEKGEECDCGTSEVCKNSDSCCDHITCKFVKNAQCSSGPCCDKCKPRSAAFICRPEKGECDIPEYCDGRNGQCPLDLFMKNGKLCAGGNGYCYQGNCPVINDQCKQLWGNGSETADPICYHKLNVQGTPNGNCGLDPKGGYIKCSEENTLCGSLQCKHGEKIPVSSRPTIQFKVNKVKDQDGKTHECKAAPSLIGKEDELHYGLVADGTKCGFQSVCVNRTCTSLKNYASGRCPKDSSSSKPCSGHGRCTNINTCYCDEGWMGHDCSKQSDGELAETTSEADVLDNPEYVRSVFTIGRKSSAAGTNLAITVVATSTVIGIVLVICFTAFFIHRKNK